MALSAIFFHTKPRHKLQIDFVVHNYKREFAPEPLCNQDKNALGNAVANF